MLFQDELCSYPPSLFDTKVFMPLHDKADLQGGLVKRAPVCVVEEQLSNVTYVLDGGSLLQRVPWSKCSSYASLCHLYIQYINRYFNNALVVFDVYTSDPTTKDETHQRRAGSEIGVDIDFTPDMLLRMKKKAFLANPRNKQKFIDLLSSLLKDNGIDVKQSPGDADYDIVMSACRAALDTDVVVVADDTDILFFIVTSF